jgi:hypothetical protein
MNISADTRRRHLHTAVVAVVVRVISVAKSGLKRARVGCQSVERRGVCETALSGAASLKQARTTDPPSAERGPHTQ